MRYAQVVPFDVCNGKGVGTALFCQGCHFHCEDCFNSETWDFNNGKEWTEEIENKFLELAERPYIKRVSILGGEPLAKENYLEIKFLIQKLKRKYPDKKVWLFSGYTFEEILKNRELMRTIIWCDVLVDGRFEKDKKDLTLKFRGSSNQRVIDVQKSLKQEKVVLYCD